MQDIGGDSIPPMLTSTGRADSMTRSGRLSGSTSVGSHRLPPATSSGKFTLVWWPDVAILPPSWRFIGDSGGPNHESHSDSRPALLCLQALRLVEVGLSVCRLSGRDTRTDPVLRTRSFRALSRRPGHSVRAFRAYQQAEAKAHVLAALIFPSAHATLDLPARLGPPQNRGSSLVQVSGSVERAIAFNDPRHS
jgi:hypothetical protein